jgi:hypothetical protein
VAGLASAGRLAGAAAGGGEYESQLALPV